MKNTASLQMKSLGFSAKEIRKLVEGKGNESIFLARIGGIVLEYFTGESKNGEWVGFKGQFMAVTKDGDQVSSGTAFFPATIANKLKEQLEQGVTEIEVKADIFAIESDKNASGYAYQCEPVITAETKSKMEKVAALLGSAPLPLQITAQSEPVKEQPKAKKSA